MDNRIWDKKNMGVRIQTARRAKEWTREQLAERVELSVNTLADIEQGKNGTRLENFAKICDALKLNADYVLFGEPGEVMGEITALLRGRDDRTIQIAQKTLQALLEALDAE